MFFADHSRARSLKSHMAEVGIDECLDMDDCDALLGQALIPDDHIGQDPLADYGTCPGSGFLSDGVTDDLDFAIPGLDASTAALDLNDPKHSSPPSTPREHSNSVPESSNEILAHLTPLSFQGAHSLVNGRHPTDAQHTDPSPLRQSCRRGKGMHQCASDGLESTFICAPAASDAVPLHDTPTHSTPPQQCPTPSVVPKQDPEPPCTRTKVCGLCAETLPLAEFQLSRRSASGPLAHGTYLSLIHI